MDREELRHHIDAVALHGAPGARRLTALMLGACWPGGPADRTERAALDLLREWRPDTGTTELPACSCSTGRCIVCN
jgi:hypothetical protein